MKNLNLFNLLTLLSTCSAGFVVPSVRKAMARGHGLPQINKNNQQLLPTGWYHQLIDMNSYGLRGDIGSLAKWDNHQLYAGPTKELTYKVSNFKPNQATESSALYDSNKYHSQKVESSKIADLRDVSGISGQQQRNDRKSGSYNNNNFLDNNSLTQNAQNKASFSSPSGSSSKLTNTAPVVKVCRSKILGKNK